MKKQFLEAGKITNTHGVCGNVKVQPWTDSLDFLQSFDVVYIDGAPWRVQDCRPHKYALILKLLGVDNYDDALALKNKVLFIDRNDAILPDGHFFIQDVLGLPVMNAAGQTLGILAEIQPLPAGELYVVRGAGGEEYLIPNVPRYIVEKNLTAGYIKVAGVEELKNLS